jgi:hypothetical protein
MTRAQPMYTSSRGAARARSWWGALTLAADTQWTSVLTLTPLDAEPVQGGIVSSGLLQTLVLAQALGEMGVAAPLLGC